MMSNFGSQSVVSSRNLYVLILANNIQQYLQCMYCRSHTFDFTHSFSDVAQSICANYELLWVKPIPSDKRHLISFNLSRRRCTWRDLKYYRRGLARSEYGTPRGQFV